MRSLRVLLYTALLIGPQAALAGDCIRTQVTDPVLTYLFKKALPESGKVSRAFGKAFSPCTRDGSSLDAAALSALVKKDTMYALSNGDHKCGARFPFDQVELVSTDKLKKIYEEYVQEDLKVWVTSPKGDSVLLTKPYLTFVDVPQSMLECFKRGPKDFTCPKNMPRKACCRSRLMKRYTASATFHHPFDPEHDITVQSGRPQLTVHKSDGTEEKLFCESSLFYF